MFHEKIAGRNGAPVSNAVTHNHQIFCCAFNANGTVFVTGSSDNLARVYSDISRLVICA